VHLLAGPGSHGYGGRLRIHRSPTLAYHSRARRKIQFQVQSLWATRDCDAIYSFGRFDYLEILLKAGMPLLHCFQNPVDQRQIDFAERRMRKRAGFQCISQNQKAHAQFSRPCIVIPNPVDTQAYSPGAGDAGYLAFLGRLTRNKGIDIAIQVSKLSGRRLVIAGNISKEEGGELFFREHVEPHLDGEQIRWIGPVNDDQKQELLGGAQALLFPIRWDEPFGIVMVEALACGTPVIATNRASTPEVLEHGRTGFLCDSEEPCAEVFAEAVGQLSALNRSDCRREAERRFDVRIVAPQVLNVLQGLAFGERDS
jgi:glycosyltransferase involved in cell wall biosynthesis